MFEGIDAIGWLVIVCALALGFGMVRFMIVVSRDGGAEAAEPAKREAGPPAEPPPR